MSETPPYHPTTLRLVCPECGAARDEPSPAPADCAYCEYEEFHRRHEDTALCPDCQQHYSPAELRRWGYPVSPTSGV